MHIQLEERSQDSKLSFGESKDSRAHQQEVQHLYTPLDVVPRSSVMIEIFPSKNYTTKEVAEILGKSRQTINNYCKTRLLRFGISRANGRKFFKGSDIIRAMQTI